VKSEKPLRGDRPDWPVWTSVHKGVVAVSLSPPEGAAPVLNFADISTHASALRDINRMVLRYSDAILAYATALLGNREEAEDVHLAVVQSILEGHFARTDSPAGTPQGRFRFYVKRAVHNAVKNHRRQRSREQGRLQRVWNTLAPSKFRWGTALQEPSAPAAEDALEAAQLSTWRDAVLRRAMEALESYERQHQDRAQPNVYHTLARLLADDPVATSETLALRLGEQVGGEYTANRTRGIIMRMRAKLAELLLLEITQQLDDPTYDNAVEELRDVGLLPYVEPYLRPR
jgi:DNA-directed RNA polymerase specialized sigma24 family protein